MSSYSEYSDNDKQNIETWLKSHNISSSCSVCKDGQYKLREGMITPLYIDFESGLLSDDGVPMICFECEACANIRLFTLYKILPYKIK